MADSFLELLYAEAPREAFHGLVTTAREREIALRLRERIDRQRSRQAELSAL